jgi:hypothetical protein
VTVPVDNASRGRLRLWRAAAAQRAAALARAFDSNATGAAVDSLFFKGAVGRARALRRLRLAFEGCGARWTWDNLTERQEAQIMPQGEVGDRFSEILWMPVPEAPTRAGLLSAKSRRSPGLAQTAAVDPFRTFGAAENRSKLVHARASPVLPMPAAVPTGERPITPFLENSDGVTHNR